MFLRLIVHPSDRVAKNRFIFHSKVAQIVHLSYDFRSYARLAEMVPSMRLVLWQDFGNQEEIVRECTSELIDYDVQNKEHDLLWEYLAPKMLELEYIPAENPGF
jgi:hypothetical protein